MAKLFGTDGVRGIANRKLTVDLAYKIGRAAAHVLGGNNCKAKFLIGKDTRISGDMLECALIAGICSSGAGAARLGIVPTSAVAFLTRCSNADAGVMISASHNSFEYNGIKLFNSDGHKLPDNIEEEIENLVENGIKNISLPEGAGIGTCFTFKKAAEEYIEFLYNSCEADSLEGITVVLDCANGSASFIAPEVFKKLGATVHAYYNNPDGININDNCGSTHTENLSRLVLELGADVGLAFDGDADRILAVDERGNIVDGDQIIAICACDLKKRGKLKKDTVVATVMSNMGFSKGLETQGIKVIHANVGDRYVLEEMLKNGYNLGGEQSGHIIFLDNNTTGDGILTGVQILSILKRQKKRISELSNIITILPQVLEKACVSEEKKQGFSEDSVILDAIAKLESKFDGQGRVLIRASGTEPIIRIMIEGKCESEIKKDAQDIAALIEQRLK